MKDIHYNDIKMLFKEVADACVTTARFGLRTLSRMSWPALLLSCIALSLVAAVLPLAIMLFIVFTAIKLLVASHFFGARKRPDDTPHRPR